MKNMTIAEVKSYINGIINEGASVSVEFTKRDGSNRKMNIIRDKELIGSIDGTGAWVSARKTTNALRNNMVVCEALDDGTSQFRTVPLTKITKIDGDEVSIVDQMV